MREQRIPLEDHRRSAAIRREDVDPLSAELDHAPGRILEPCDHPQRRGLTAAARSEKRDELTLPDLDKADQLLAIPESLDPGELTPFLQANALHLRARLDAARGNHDQVEQQFRTAAALYREFDLTFHQAVSQLEHADWLTSQNRADEAEPILTEAHHTFEQLQATPWRERTARALPAQREAEAAIS